MYLGPGHLGSTLMQHTRPRSLAALRTYGGGGLSVAAFNSAQADTLLIPLALPLPPSMVRPDRTAGAAGRRATPSQSWRSRLPVPVVTHLTPRRRPWSRPAAPRQREQQTPGQAGRCLAPARDGIAWPELTVQGQGWGDSPLCRRPQPGRRANRRVSTQNELHRTGVCRFLASVCEH